MSDLSKRFPRYSKLVALYPAAYKQKYGDQMLQTLADMLDHAPTKTQRIGVWARLSADFPPSIAHQQFSYIGGIMTNEMPNYVRRNAAIGAAMLVPFMLALVANSVDRIVDHHALYHSWLWSMPLLAVWVLWLPMLAAVIALATLSVFLVRQSKARRISWLKVLFDIRHNWPLLAIGFIGIAILGMVFFHDSVHCITGNPIREIHNPHATLRCIEQR